MQILLASSSIARQQLMQRLGLKFNCYSPNLDETAKQNETVLETVARLSQEKALAGARKYPQHLCIGADQLAIAPKINLILGKPQTREEAIWQLTQISKQEIIFHAGVCVYNPITQNINSAIIDTSIQMKELSESEIVKYIDIDKPLHCAGSMRSEGLGLMLTTKCQSDDPTALPGLPLITLAQFLRLNDIKLF